MAKVVFILQRRDDKTPDDVRKHWSGEEHMSRVRQLPGCSASAPEGTGQPS